MYHFKVLFIFFISVLILYALKVEAILPLTGRTIIIDSGHGAEDPGTSYGKIYEKNWFVNKWRGLPGTECCNARRCKGSEQQFGRTGGLWFL